MSGTKIGGVKAAAKNIENDPDFYKRIGSVGGSNGHTGGFYVRRDLAQTAGAKGGRISKRRPRVIVVTAEEPKSRIPLLRRLFWKTRI